MSRPPVPQRTAAALKAGAVAQQSKIAPSSTDRNVAQPSNLPDAKVGSGEVRTKIYTYFTSAPSVGESTPVLYTGDRLWAKLTLVLETAGPVAIGDSSNLGPVLGGKGELLTTDVPTDIVIAKGTRLYILATGVNRVKVKIEPLPWLEQIAATLALFAGSVMRRLK